MDQVGTRGGFLGVAFYVMSEVRVTQVYAFVITNQVVHGRLLHYHTEILHKEPQTNIKL